MSMHKIPLTPIEEEGLRVHGLDIGTPSQLSDVFRQGVAWGQKAILAKPEKTIIKRGQVFDTKTYGKVRFDRLDFYRGECTVKLTGIEYPGTYYPFLGELEKEGFTVIDN